MPYNPLTALRYGRQKDIPTILGVTSGEGAVFIATVFNQARKKKLYGIITPHSNFRVFIVPEKNPSLKLIIILYCSWTPWTSYGAPTARP